MKRADAEAIHIEGSQKKAKGDRKMLYRCRARRGKNRATIKRAGAEAIQIEGPQREGDNEERGRRGNTNRRPAEGKTG